MKILAEVIGRRLVMHEAPGFIPADQAGDTEHPDIEAAGLALMLLAREVLFRQPHMPRAVQSEGPLIIFDLGERQLLVVHPTAAGTARVVVCTTFELLLLLDELMRSVEGLIGHRMEITLESGITVTLEAGAAIDDEDDDATLLSLDRLPS